MVKRKEFESEFRGEPCTEILFTISRNAVADMPAACAEGAEGQRGKDEGGGVGV